MTKRCFVYEKMLVRLFSTAAIMLSMLCSIGTVTSVQSVFYDGVSSGKLPAPSGFKILTVTDHNVTLKWNKVNGADGYKVYHYNEKTKKVQCL